MTATLEDRPTAELTKAVSRLGARERAILSAQIASDYRGRDILVLDLTGVVQWVDYLVIGTGTSRRQIVAAADEIDRQLTERGDRRRGVEGYEAGDWVVLDYGDLIVHLFDDRKRAYYQLESLWEDAPRVPWERPRAAGDDEAPASGETANAWEQGAPPQ